MYLRRDIRVVMDSLNINVYTILVDRFLNNKKLNKKYFTNISSKVDLFNPIILQQIPWKMRYLNWGLDVKPFQG